MSVVIESCRCCQAKDVFCVEKREREKENRVVLKKWVHACEARHAKWTLVETIVIVAA